MPYCQLTHGGSLTYAAHGRMKTLTPGKSDFVPDEIYKRHKERLQLIQVEPDRDQTCHLEPVTGMMSSEGIELLEEALVELQKQWSPKVSPESYLRNQAYKGSTNWTLAEQIEDIRKQLENGRK